MHSISNTASQCIHLKSTLHTHGRSIRRLAFRHFGGSIKLLRWCSFFVARGIFCAPRDGDVDLWVIMVFVEVEGRHHFVDPTNQLDDSITSPRHAEGIKAPRTRSVDVRDNIIGNDDFKWGRLQELLAQAVQENRPLMVAKGKPVRQRYVERASRSPDCSASSIAAMRLMRPRLRANGRLSDAQELLQPAADTVAITATVAIAAVAIVSESVGRRRGCRPANTQKYMARPVPVGDRHAFPAARPWAPLRARPRILAAFTSLALHHRRRKKRF